MFVSVEYTGTMFSDPLKNISTHKDRPKADGGNQKLKNRSYEERWSDAEVKTAVKIFQLTSTEEERLQELKDAVADVDHWMNNAHDAVMFLKEHHGKVKKCDKMFRKMVAWREENGIERLLEEFVPPPGFHYAPVAILQGVGREAEPIHYEGFGIADTSELVQRYGRDEYFKRAMWLREMDTWGSWTEDYIEKHGQRHTQVIAIMDMEGLSSQDVRPHLMLLLQEILRCIQDYYPNLCKKVVMLRGPLLFKLTWFTIKGFFDANLRKSIVVTDSSNYLEVLDEMIDRAVLPQIVQGGKGDAVHGFNVVWTGGEIPDDDDILAEYSSVSDTASEASSATR